MTKTLSLFTWLATHWDLIMMALGELVVACVVLVGAVKSCCTAFAKLADLTATKIDNNVLQWISSACDVAAALLDRVLRKIPRPALGPSTLLQPITTKESRAAARQTVTTGIPSIPPIGTGTPPVIVVTGSPATMWDAVQDGVERERDTPVAEPTTDNTDKEPSP